MLVRQKMVRVHVYVHVCTFYRYESVCLYVFQSVCMSVSQSLDSDHNILDEREEEMMMMNDGTMKIINTS